MKPNPTRIYSGVLFLVLTLAATAARAQVTANLLMTPIGHR
jgi:hypothetical protein